MGMLAVVDCCLGASTIFQKFLRQALGGEVNGGSSWLEAEERGARGTGAGFLLSLHRDE